MSPELPYELLDVLGRGSFASVHLARHLDTGRLAAVKILVPSGDPEAAGVLLAAEADILSKLPPGVGPALFEWGEDFLVLEHLTGRDLSRLGPAPPDLASDVARQLAFTLRKLHDAGFVHGDLTPSHVVLTADGTVRLLDFGFAHPRGMRPRIQLGGAGTPAYVSPEAASGRFGDPRADLYSAGAVLYEVLTGSPPFVGPETSDALRARAERLPEPPSRLVPGLPRSLDEMILTLLQPKPANRYADAGIFESAAEELAASPEIGRLRRHEPSEYILSPQFQGREKEIDDVLRLYFSGEVQDLRVRVVRGGFGVGKSRFLEECRLAFRPFGIFLKGFSTGDGEEAPAPDPGGRTGSTDAIPVFILDDLETLSAEELAAVEGALAQQRHVPALLLCAAGPTATSAGLPGSLMPSGISVEETTVPPLSPDQVKRLTRSMLGFASVPAAIEDAVVTETRGNPGLAVALIKDLADAGIFVRTGVSWEFREPLPSPMPVGKAQAIHRAGRALNAGGEVRRLLEGVGVLEEAATEDRLRKVTGLRKTEFDGALDAAVAEGFLLPGPPLAFPRARFREAFWSSLPEPRKVDLHAAAAGALRWEKTREVNARRGVHLLRAGEMDQGSKVLLDAAEEALGEGEEELASAWVQEVVSAERTGPETEARARALAEQLREGE
ncbi:MAG: serine/threonine protein kinase, partial [Planctomycetota bacterium]